MRLPLVLMLLGEGVMIVAENYAAKHADQVWTIPQRIALVCVIFASGFLLLYAYKTGYATFGNIWIVVAISIAAILIVEPLVSRYMFHQIPTPGAFLGLALGVIGLLCSILWR